MTGVHDPRPADCVPFAVVGRPRSSRKAHRGRNGGANDVSHVDVAENPHHGLAANPFALTTPVVLSTRRADAAIEGGTDCGIPGTTLVAAERTATHDRVLAGGNASIVDIDGPPLTPEDRSVDINAGVHAPIGIGGDMFGG